MESEKPLEVTLATVADRRRAPRFIFLSRADVKVPGQYDPFWGSVLNISRRGLSLQIRQSLQLNSIVKVTLHFMGENQREVVEELNARVVWRTGENTGMKFETPLIESSQLAQRVPHLMEHLKKSD